MTIPDLIFQRTQAGRDEIYQKSHGLTQSERLVLIMIDGVSSYQVVRNKLPVLAEERFERAWKKLQKKELIIEVLLPVANQPADELEPTVIDRFLQQDPLDPVTIIMIDPDEYEDISSLTATPVPAVAAVAPIQEKEVSIPAVQNAPAHDIFAQIDELAQEIENEMKTMPVFIPQESRPILPSAPSLEEKAVPPRPGFQLHWGYWVIAVGLAFILGYGIARLVR